MGKKVIVLGFLTIIAISIIIGGYFVLLKGKNEPSPALQEKNPSESLSEISAAGDGKTIPINQRKYIKGYIEKAEVNSGALSIRIKNQAISQDFTSDKYTYIFTTINSAQKPIMLQEIEQGNYNLIGKYTLIEYKEENGKLVAKTISVT